MLPETMSRPAVRKVYYLKTRQLMWIVGILLIAVGLMDAVFFSFSHALSGKFDTVTILSALSSMLSGAAFFAVGAIYIWIAQKTYIATSPEGLTYSNTGLYTIQTRWDNIDYVGPVKMRLLGTYPCIVLRAPVHLGWLSGLAWALSTDQRERTIPLPPGWDRRAELEQDIKFYAPHVSGL